ncbi:tetratricopeptide repeat protein [Shewanella litorisediminis]|uniref:Tetratricopeptide repeat protein n=1 Tax=Shewanella litorisediminis TaxID=1173586 RepID=A0ABX7G4U2_9GAMM|nr:tetratricopeptide repeat protein [Shewanella litorisediminis]MCL2917814.1 tetratricopeptide repeat protein [Shewanella litorisediminis]QRH02255.1 tetratricopeptide repeat protein [Shewanella litorisediminis]
MSVINQMLKDLDKRAEPHQLQKLPAAVAIPASKAPGLPWRWLVLLSLLLIAIALMLWHLKASDSGDAVALSPMSSGQKAPVQSQDSAESGTAPASTSTASNAQVTAAQVTTAQVTTKAASNAVESQTLASTDARGDTASAMSTAQAREPDESAPNVTRDGEHEILSEPAAVSAKAPAIPETSMTGAAVGSTANVKSVPPAAEPSGADMNTNTPAPGSMAVTEVVLTPAEQAERAMLKANTARDAGKLDEAIRQYATALSYEPARHEARRQLAALHYGQGKPGDAIQLLQRGLAQFPEQSSFALLLGRLWREQGDKLQAMAALQSIGDTDPKARDKWLLVADMARETQDHALAESAYLKLLDSGMERAQWWLGLAYAQDAQGKVADARRHYQRALGIAGLSADARAYVENRLMQLGERQ